MLWKCRKTISRGPRLGPRPFQTFCSSMSVHVRPVRSVYVRPRPSCPSRLLAEKVKKYDRNVHDNWSDYLDLDIARQNFATGTTIHTHTTYDWSQLRRYHFSEDCSSLAGRSSSRPSTSVYVRPVRSVCPFLLHAAGGVSTVYGPHCVRPVRPRLSTSVVRSRPSRLSRSSTFVRSVLSFVHVRLVRPVRTRKT